MNANQRPTQWLRDWIDERCRLADGCIDLRAEEVRVWYMFRELLLPEMDKQDAAALNAQFSAVMPEWLEAYMVDLSGKIRDESLDQIQRTIAGLVHTSLASAYLTALCHQNHETIQAMASANSKLLQAYARAQD